jgi:dTDP-glucose pyrophosphorylase
MRDAIRILEVESGKYVCIIDNDGVLLGLFTQGDMRRFLLNGGNLQAPVSDAMNPAPVTFSSRDDAREASKTQRMVVYPIVDGDGHLCDCFCLGDVEHLVMKDAPLKGTPLVVMAGGMGTRLYPYTKVLPKALIPIGDETIIERVIEQFTRWGCDDVYIIINYKGRMIKSYFEYLETDYDVHFVEEKEFLGTGGGLSLLAGKIGKPFFLSNCDILVDADFDCVLKTHLAKRNLITFVAAMKEISIPYGVIEASSDGRIVDMQEKPQYSFLTNTGVYVVDPRVIDDIPRDTFIHITDIAMSYIDKNSRVGVFPVSGKCWLDMGQIGELDTMLKELGIEEK